MLIFPLTFPYGQEKSFFVFFDFFLILLQTRLSSYPELGGDFRV
jgi:hypothetical protein